MGGAWGPGGLGPPLFLDQTEARMAEEIFLGDLPPHFSKGLDDPHPPTPPPQLCQGLEPALHCPC